MPKTHWFRDHERPPEEVGAAVAMRAWRSATSAVRTLAEDGPITDRTGGHLALVEELLLLVVQHTDRLAWLRGIGDEARRRLMEAMVERLAHGLSDHAAEQEAGHAFLKRAGRRLDEYATIAYSGNGGEEPGFAVYNLLGSRGCEATGRDRDLWLHGRLAEVEGPELIAEMHPVVVELLRNLETPGGVSAG
ncbi:MAG: hypothetical protein ACOC1T_00860 [Halorhodospira sp.]